jgi:hypothetical protein
MDLALLVTAVRLSTPSLALFLLGGALVGAGVVLDRGASARRPGLDDARWGTNGR